jgi:CheY-like chemotaxis protein
MDPKNKPKATILVVDDEQIVHESVQRILEEEGYRVASAFRVDQALDKLSRESFDLVLTDLMMPDGSGMDAVEAVARDHPNTGVVMFTGYATVDSAVQSMKLGAFDYLPKPFTPDELITCVQNSIEQTRKTRRDREIERTYADAEKAISSSLDLKEILNLICSSVVSLFKVKGSAVLMLHKQDKTLEVSSYHGLSEEYLQKGLMDSSRSIPIVFDSGEPVLVPEEAFDSSLQFPDAARKEGITSILSVPLKLKDTIIGFLRIYSTDKRTFDDEEMDLLLKFADQGARALENALAYERVRADIEGMKRGIPGPVARRMQEQG